MKKVAHVSALFVVVAIVVLLVVGSAGADPSYQEGEIEPEPGGEIEIEPGGEGGGEGEPEAGAAAEAEPSGAATRVDFELSDDVAREGTYIVQEAGGRFVASWYALDGWRDSGWIENLKISNKEVHVQVLYYPSPGAEPTVMRILNPAGGTEYGWLARGMAHAIEVEFPDEATVATAANQQPAAEAVPTADTQPAGSAGEQVHVVQAGNNLFRIGIQYGCSVAELAAHNGIADPNLISVGQEIRIPSNCVG